VPQYGGSLTIRSIYDAANWDPYNNQSLTTFDGAWMERLFTDEWTLNPSMWNYQIAFRPDIYNVGLVAQDWEFTGPGTFVVHVRQGIYWQNISPANGRELTAADVAYNFDRAFGVGGGFTQGSPSLSSNTDYSTLQSVIATGPYTVTFQWGINNPEFILETLEAQSGGSVDIECPEAVTLYGNLNDWHHAIGTGPFILTDFVDNSELTMIKNTNYWGHDERHLSNQLPYVDSLKVLIIANNPTALAAMRAGKIDVMDGVAFADAQNMLKTNPEILQISYPNNTAFTVGPKNDAKPFSDINVREAMQMALDLPTIAKTYFNGTASPSPSTLTSNYFPAGWGFPYSQWPADLQAQYAYNPSTAKQLLATAGYPNGFNTDCVADIAADASLLQIVQSYWAAVGINMSITTMDSTSWTNFVLTQHKQDALAYRASGLYGLTYQPVRQITALLPGNSANYLDITDPALTAYEAQIQGSTTTTGLQQVISSMNEYIAGQHYAISLVQPSIFGIYQPWLKGYNGQYLSISGAALGPQLLGFYGARFWIDQNAKNSFGQ
jgi:peptide/nickel transport system substrate-binding protein